MSHDQKFENVTKANNVTKLAHELMSDRECMSKIRTTMKFSLKRFIIIKLIEII